MGRLIAVFTAVAVLCQAAPAAAAELTRVASSGDPDDPFDLDLSVRWERVQRRGAINREYAEGTGGPFAAVKQLSQLRYAETTNRLVSRVAVGLWQDLELSAELPYVLSQELSWRLASGVGPSGIPNTIQNNPVTPDGAGCLGAVPGAAPCPIFKTDGDQVSYQGGALDDLRVGLAWAPFSQERDDTKPSWVVGVTVTLPTAKLYDPVAGRDPNFWENPYLLKTDVGPIGQKVWRYELQTTLSRRVGPVEPYFRTSATLLQKSSGTYSNCDRAAELVTGSQATGSQGRVGPPGMVELCAADPARWGARLPWYAGLTFGAELVPYEDAAAVQKIAFDLRLTGQYTSRARWYNELTPATGKLLATGGHVTIGGRLGLLLRASQHLTVQAAGTFSWASPHDLTGEDLDTAAVNPNFDWRYDAPGRRFRAAEGTVLGLEVTGMLSF